MALFVRRSSGGGSGQLTERQRSGIPHRFEAMAEALASGSDPGEVGLHLGAALAQDGVPLAEVLDRMRTTSRVVLRQDPPYAALAALAAGWSESILGYLHDLSCEDPLTGLASLAHVRARLSELYRGELRQRTSPTERHALVVVEVAEDAEEDDLSRQLQLAGVGDAARTVFSGDETIGRVARNRLVVVAGRDRNLGRRLDLLRTLLGLRGSAGDDVRVWVEGLPPSDELVGATLDELTRS